MLHLARTTGVNSAAAEVLRKARNAAAESEGQNGTGLPRQSLRQFLDEFHQEQLKQIEIENSHPDIFDEDEEEEKSSAVIHPCTAFLHEDMLADNYCHTCRMYQCFVCSEMCVDAGHAVFGGNFTQRAGGVGAPEKARDLNYWTLTPKEQIEHSTSRMQEFLNAGAEILLDLGILCCPCGKPFRDDPSSAVCCMCLSATCSDRCHKVFCEERGKCVFASNFIPAKRSEVHGCRCLTWAVIQHCTPGTIISRTTGPRYVDMEKGRTSDCVILRRGHFQFGNPVEETLTSMRLAESDIRKSRAPFRVCMCTCRNCSPPEPSSIPKARRDNTINFEPLPASIHRVDRESEGKNVQVSSSRSFSEVSWTASEMSNVGERPSHEVTVPSGVHRYEPPDSGQLYSSVGHRSGTKLQSQTNLPLTNDEESVPPPPPLDRQARHNSHSALHHDEGAKHSCAAATSSSLHFHRSAAPHGSSMCTCEDSFGSQLNSVVPMDGSLLPTGHPLHCRPSKVSRLRKEWKREAQKGGAVE